MLECIPNYLNTMIFGVWIVKSKRLIGDFENDIWRIRENAMWALKHHLFSVRVREKLFKPIIELCTSDRKGEFKTGDYFKESINTYFPYF